MSSRKIYSREFKVEAIALAKRSGKRINQIEEELGIAQGLLSKWKRQARSEGPTAFAGNGRLPEDEEEIRRLKREQYTVSQMCEVLGISRSAYYAWRHRQPSPRAEHRRDLLARIQEVHRATHQIYGSRRVYAQLNQQGVNCSQYLVARLMCENGLRACRQTRLEQHLFALAKNELRRFVVDDFG